ncbi:MAG: hypothetical protein CSA33_08175 [Desulfobulbus propionicus]|nr:MAG: hypothetical protein CSA33_08175 [Desulfobulbus propionicus]
MPALLGIALLILYSLAFVVQEQRRVSRSDRLESNLPASLYRVASGYLQQLTAEILFIKTSVFLGGLQPGVPPASYEAALGNNFEVMTQLYPRFKDPYFFCQGFLSPISKEAAAKASGIFATGVQAYPADFVLRLFYGSNFSLGMNDYQKAAHAFAEAAQLPDAPPLFGHLAALFSAQEGNIAAGLLSLQTLLSTEKDEELRARYAEEIRVFEQALAVQQAIAAYTRQHGLAPHTLEQLVPDFVPQLPGEHGPFILVYEPPRLLLKRPDKRKTQ